MRKTVVGIMAGMLLLTTSGCTHQKSTKAKVHHPKSVKVVKQHKNIKKVKKTKKKETKKTPTPTTQRQKVPAQRTNSQQNQQGQTQQQQTTQIQTNQNTQINGKLPPSTDIHDFVNRYGVSPALYLKEHYGMSVKQALDQTPDSMKTSGEKQSQYILDNGGSLN